MPGHAASRWVPLLVATGGTAGTGLRAAVGALVTAPGGAWPWATLVVNLAGAGLLGWLVAGLGPGSVRRRAFLGTGVLGAFTTFSTFAVEVAALRNRPLVAGAYAVVSLGAGLALAAAGMAAGRRR